MKGTIRFRVFCRKGKLTTLSEMIDEISFREWERDNGKTELTNREKEELEIAESIFALLKKNKTLKRRCRKKGLRYLFRQERRGHQYKGAAVESIVEKEFLTANELNYQVEITLKYLSFVLVAYAIEVDVETCDQGEEGFSEGFSKGKNDCKYESDYLDSSLIRCDDTAKRRGLEHFVEFETDFGHYSEELDAFMIVSEDAEEVICKNAFVPRKVFENKKGIIEKDTGKGYIRSYGHFVDFINEKGEYVYKLDGSVPLGFASLDMCVYLYVADNFFDTDKEHYNESLNTFTAYNEYVDKTIEVPADKFRDENGLFVEKQIPVKQDDDYYFVRLNL